MLSFLAGRAKFCDGITRREALRVGGLGALSWPGSQGLAQASSSTAGLPRFGRAKSVVLVTLYGGPPQTETFDMKPGAPVEARGPFRPIRTNMVDLHICEHLPRLSGMADKYTLVRSFNHTNSAHGGGIYTFLTGWPYPIENQNFPSRPEDHPHYGAVVDALRPRTPGVPTSTVVGGMILPQFLGPGQTGGYLGKTHNPFFANSNLNDDRPATDLLKLRSGVPAVRMENRHQLLDQLRQTQQLLDKNRKTTGFSVVQQQARNLIDSQQFMAAFDVGQEPDAARERYGESFLGQNMLLARRLVEVEVPVIQVSDIPLSGEQHWDLHYANIFDRLKDQLLPNLDRSVSALLSDLDERGLLDQTLVVVGGEFGRTPWIDHLSNPPQGGRQHWPHVYSMLLAGGGIRRGEVYGQSDEIAAYPVSRRIAPCDLAATIFHLMGVDPGIQVRCRDGRMRPVCRGQVIDGII